MISNEVYIFDCNHLLNIYEQCLKPYIGVTAFFVNVEEAIMNDLYVALEGEKYYEMTLNEYIKDLVIPTLIKRFFIDTYMQAIKVLIDNIMYSLSDKLLIEFTIQRGYILTAVIFKEVPLYDF